MNLEHSTRATVVARYLRTLAVSQSEPGGAVAFALAQNWSDERRIVAQIRSAVPSLGSSPSVVAPVALDFATLVRPMTILGRMPGLRRMPFGARLIGMTAATRAHWVRAGSAIPIAGQAFTQPYELHRKACAAILVAADELLRDADPLVERALVADLVGATAAAIDEAFVDVGNTGSDATPAAITSGGFTVASTGDDLAAIDNDLGALIDALVDAGSNLTSAAWVLHPRSAAYLSKLRGTGGAPAFPDISVTGGMPAFPDVSARGGTLLGLPVLVSAGVPLEPGSPPTTQISLIDGDGVLLLDEGEADISLSQHATLELDTEPTGDATTPTAASKHRVSLFQSNATAIKAMRHMNWLPRRSTAAATLTGVSY